MLLIISYILLSITVGASSTIGLKQFYNIYFTFYQKQLDLYNFYEKYSQDNAYLNISKMVNQSGYRK